jgi:hypothetical protein
MPSRENRLDGLPKACPVLHLGRDGTVDQLPDNACIEDEVIRKLDGLAHAVRVAFCHRQVKGDAEKPGRRRMKT